MKKLLSIISIIIFSSLGFLQYEINSLKNKDFGATIPTIVALFETSLASSVTSTGTSMTLVTGTDKQGNALSGTYGFIIDEGSASEEFVLCSATGTALSGCTRGISVTDGKTAVTALQKTHRRGASIKITNYPQLAILSRILNASESIPNKIYYPSAQDFSLASSSVLVDKNYVDSGILAGCTNASTTVKGCYESATLAEILASTATGGTGAALVVTADYFTASSSANKVVVTNPSGYIDSSFLNISSGLEATGNNAISVKVVSGGGLTAAAEGLKFTASKSFGGTGADGALNITTGNTAVSAGNQRTLVKNYTSISISAGASLSFSNPAPAGTLIVLKSQGACTISGEIDVRLMGAAGGATSADGSEANFIIDDAGTHGGNAGATSIGGGNIAAGTILLLDDLYASSSYHLESGNLRLLPGSGGAGGGQTGAGGAGGAGGRGGGALILECNGALNFASGGSIVANGSNGSDGAVANNGGGGGGGGGAGGSVIVLYNALTANSGSVTVAGGNGGNGGNGSGAGNTGGGGASGAGGLFGAGGVGGQGGGNGTTTCANGGNAAGLYAGLAGTCSAGANEPDGGGGGGGAGGWYLIYRNPLFY